MSTPRAWAAGSGSLADERLVSIETSSGVVSDFVLAGLGVRVVFGNGAVNGLTDEVRRLGLGAATVVCTPALGRRAARLGRVIAGAAAGPMLRVGTTAGSDRDGDVDRLVSAATKAEGFVAVGGGRAIRVARQAAAITRLPVIAVPTTYAGREMSAEPAPPTAAAGGGATAPLPATVIYDPVLTTALSQQVTGVSALAAIARAALALCAGVGNPLAELAASVAIQYLAEGAHDAVLHPRGLVGRSRALYGAHLVALITTGASRDRTASTDRIDDALADAGGLHSSDVAAVLLAHRLEAASRQCPLALAAVAAALRRDDAVAGVLELAADLGAPTSFADLGLEPARMAAIRNAVSQIEVSRTERQALTRALSERSPVPGSN
jgi:maleylacetate reductase